MEETGNRVCVPRRDPSVEDEPFLDFAAGYVLRAVEQFPKQGVRAPWKLKMNYFIDRKNLRKATIHDEVMDFYNPAPEKQAVAS
jgi:hypothetical protein